MTAVSANAVIEELARPQNEVGMRGDLGVAHRAEVAARDADADVRRHALVPAGDRSPVEFGLVQLDLASEPEIGGIRAQVRQIRQHAVALEFEEVALVVRVGGVEARHQVGRQRTHQLPQQLLAGSEVVVEAADGDARPRSDGGQRGLVDAGIAGLLERSGEDACPRVGRLGVAGSLGDRKSPGLTIAQRHAPKY